MEEKTPGVPNPEQPESPVTPPAPEAPVTPAAPAAPAGPVQPATPPQPVMPAEAEAPEVPETSSISEAPLAPETSAVPAAPAVPEVPETPAAPEAPEAPAAPEASVAPAAPAAPEAPAAPVAPTAPATPEAPVAPAAPETPAAPAAPAAPEAPASPAAPAAPEAPAAPVAPEAPVAPAAPAQPTGFDPTQPFGGQQSQQPAAPQPAQPQQPVGFDPTQPAQPYGAQPTQQPVQPMGYNGQGAYPPPPVPPAYAQKSSGKAIGALVCGILAILLSGFPILGIILGIVAIVLGSKAVKQFGKDGKATAGKICGIVGIVFSVIWFILASMVTCAALSAYDDSVDTGYAPLDSAIESSGEDSGSVAIDDSDLTADEQGAQAAAVAELDKIVNQDSELVQSLADELDEGFTEATGVSHAELGVDPTTLATWLLSDFSYEIDGVYVDDASGTMTATVYADIELRDSFSFMMSFYDKIDALNNSDEVLTMSVDEVKARLGELYQEAMDESASVMTSYYAALQLEKQGDQWVVDQDSWEDEFENMFILY